MLGEMDADAALGAGQLDVALEEGRRQQGVDPRREGLDPAQPASAAQLLVGQAAEDDLGAGQGGGALGLGARQDDLVAGRGGADALDEVVGQGVRDQDVHWLDLHGPAIYAATARGPSGSRR